MIELSFLTRLNLEILPALLTIERLQIIEFILESGDGKVRRHFEVLVIRINASFNNNLTANGLRHASGPFYTNPNISLLSCVVIEHVANRSCIGLKLLSVYRAGSKMLLPGSIIEIT